MEKLPLPARGAIRGQGLRRSRRALARQHGATGPEFEVLDVIEGAGGRLARLLTRFVRGMPG
ncbi:hypothetical protein [Nonomuraea sp. NPDC005730]|uniref:hypothetical protein n=1 Tax=Nonomuraea sp. NPDC005730 TaxID=3157055 RepID=UPI0033C255B3